MKKLTFITIILLSAGFTLSSCSNNQQETKKETESVTSGQSTAVSYQCPMKCEGDKMYDKAGSCPVCNMDLEPVEQNNDHHDHDSGHHHQH